MAVDIQNLEAELQKYYIYMNPAERAEVDQLFPTLAGTAFPLVQKRQSVLLAACGFPCEPAGEHAFSGTPIPMYRPTGERRPAVASVIGYGGAAYGGKSYGMLQLARTAGQLWPGVQVAYFRRTYPELDGPGAAIQKSYEVFNQVAGDREGGKEWYWDNGSTFFFRHCQNEQDVYTYQSQQIDIALFDEATHFTWAIIDYLLTRNRASGGVQELGFLPFAVLSSNPGNVGHVWYSQLFDVEEKQGPHEQVKQVRNPNSRQTRTYFIPAFLEDNEIGVAQDPEYESRLEEREPSIYRALRKGDWTIFAGQAFPLWIKDRIACAPFDLSDDDHSHWPKWRAIDYGYDHPFICGWFTADPRTERVYIYRAVMKSGLTDTEQAKLVKEMTPVSEHISWTYAGHDMWKTKNMKGRTTTTADEYRDEGIPLTKADIDRQSGKRKIDRKLADQADGRPGIQVFEPFFYVFQCMTSLIRDKSGKEDVEKVDGDDPYDMARYGLTDTRVAKSEGKKKVHPASGVKGI
jgi:phage terminase large subunit